MKIGFKFYSRSLSGLSEVWMIFIQQVYIYKNSGTLPYVNEPT